MAVAAVSGRRRRASMVDVASVLGCIPSTSRSDRIARKRIEGCSRCRSRPMAFGRRSHPRGVAASQDLPRPVRPARARPTDTRPRTSPGTSPAPSTGWRGQLSRLRRRMSPITEQSSSAAPVISPSPSARSTRCRRPSAAGRSCCELSFGRDGGRRSSGSAMSSLAGPIAESDARPTPVLQAAITGHLR